MHNGIILNYIPIKQDLMDKGVKFSSDTDSEVIAQLIGYHFNVLGQPWGEAVKKALAKLEGKFLFFSD